MLFLLFSSSGHYTSYVLNQSEKQWYCCDDSRTPNRIDTDSVVTNDAYVLFYQKRKRSHVKSETSSLPVLSVGFQKSTTEHSTDDSTQEDKIAEEKQPTKNKCTALILHPTHSIPNDSAEIKISVPESKPVRQKVHSQTLQWILQLEEKVEKFMKQHQNEIQQQHQQQKEQKHRHTNDMIDTAEGRKPSSRCKLMRKSEELKFEQAKRSKYFSNNKRSTDGTDEDDEQSGQDESDEKAQEEGDEMNDVQNENNAKAEGDVDQFVEEGSAINDKNTVRQQEQELINTYGLDASFLHQSYSYKLPYEMFVLAVSEYLNLLNESEKLTALEKLHKGWNLTTTHQFLSNKIQMNSLNDEAIKRIQKAKYVVATFEKQNEKRTTTVRDQSVAECTVQTTDQPNQSSARTASPASVHSVLSLSSPATGVSSTHIAIHSVIPTVPHIQTNQTHSHDNQHLNEIMELVNEKLYENMN